MINDVTVNEGVWMGRTEPGHPDAPVNPPHLGEPEPTGGNSAVWDEPLPWSDAETIDSDATWVARDMRSPAFPFAKVTGSEEEGDAAPTTEVTTNTDLTTNTDAATNSTDTTSDATIEIDLAAANPADADTRIRKLIRAPLLPRPARTTVGARSLRSIPVIVGSTVVALVAVVLAVTVFGGPSKVGKSSPASGPTNARPPTAFDPGPEAGAGPPTTSPSPKAAASPSASTGVVRHAPTPSAPPSRPPAPPPAPPQVSGPTGVITGFAGKCLRVADPGAPEVSQLEMHACDGSQSEIWTMATDGTVRALGKCLDVEYSGISDGVPVRGYTCNGTTAQQWVFTPGRDLVNPRADKCLDVAGFNSNNGGLPQMWTCAGTANQKWTVPGH
jgi:hypothetical protein